MCFPYLIIYPVIAFHVDVCLNRRYWSIIISGKLIKIELLLSFMCLVTFLFFPSPTIHPFTQPNQVDGIWPHSVHFTFDRSCECRSLLGVFPSSLRIQENSNDSHSFWVCLLLFTFSIRAFIAYVLHDCILRALL